MEHGKEAEKMSFTFTWTVENISFFPTVIYSPDFTVHAMENSLWSLKLHFHQDDKHVSLILFRGTIGDSEEVIVDFELSALAEDGSVLVSQKEIELSFKPDDEHVIPNFSTFEELFKTIREPLIPPRNLKIRCKLWSEGELTDSDKCSGRTTMAYESSSFFWNVNGFSDLVEYEKRTFLVGFESQMDPTLQMNLFITRDSNNSEENLNMEILEINEDYEKIEYGICFLSLLDVTRNVVDTKKSHLNFIDKKAAFKLPSLFSRNHLTAHKSQYLPNDTLSLACTIFIDTCSLSYHTDYVHFDHDEKLPEHEPCIVNRFSVDFNETESLLNDLRCLYVDRILCDVNLKIADETFPVHKNILSARSRVFKAMFENDMKEKLKECVDIPDVNVETMRRMLLYVYTNTLEDMQWKEASQLYEASDKYEIFSLKHKCSSLLKANLCPENACEILVVADMHQDKELKAFIQEYIMNHSKEFFGSNQWKSMIEFHCQLSAETMHFILEKQNN